MAVRTVFVLGLVLAAFALPSVAAEEVNLKFTATADNKFMVEGYEGANPTIRVNPGDTVNVAFVNGDGFHNLVVNLASGAVKTEMGKDGNLTFTVPEDGADIEYWCEPHKSMGMKGKFDVAMPGDSKESLPPGDSADTKSETKVDTPKAPGLGAPALLVALVALAFVARRRF